MSRNEIRLRRHRMTGSGADRFRNYSEVLGRHERDVRVRKMLRVFLFFMAALLLVGLMFVLWRIEEGDIPFEKGDVPKAASLTYDVPELRFGDCLSVQSQQIVNPIIRSSKSVQDLSTML